MHKNALLLLSLFLDFVWINTLVGLGIHFFGVSIAGMFGIPLSWGGGITVSLLVLLALRLLNVSAGDWMLASAVAEREAGVTARQWPNLLLGTVGFGSGLHQAAGWTQPGDGMPFAFLVEDTPAKAFVLAFVGALSAVGGILLLRFTRGARLFNFVLVGLGVVVMAVNLLFFREAMLSAMVLRRVSKGADPAGAEAIVAASPLYGGAVFALMFFLIYLCRERDHPVAA